MALAILDAHNSLLDWDLVTVFIQLPEGDDIILEAWEEEDTNELDFFSCLTGERHDVTDLSWNQRPVTEPHDSLQLATEFREGLYSSSCGLSHRCPCTNLQVSRRGPGRRGPPTLAAEDRPLAAVRG
jgi:predicted carbohydrate-binding protein with CBM5 and CBM33 domain